MKLSAFLAVSSPVVATDHGSVRKLRTDIGKRLAAIAAAAVVPLLMFAGSAAAATAPSVVTGAVSAVSPTTATLTGTVNPNGAATTWHFEYGKTTSYGTSTAATSAGAGTANIQVSANLTGLSPGTTYYYQLVATSAGGTTPGLNGILNTTAGPDAVTGGASNVTPTSATLNGTVNANGRATTYYFEYGKTTAYGTKTAVQNGGSATSPVAVTAAVSGLQTGQAYHFRLVGSNDAGSTQGADMSFSLSSAPTVTTKAASSITSTSAKLNGSVNPNGQATEWYFDYGPTTAYGSKTPVASVGSDTKTTNVSSTVNGLPAGVYHFRLVATNASGTSDGNDKTFGSGSVPVVLTGTTQGAGTSSGTLTGSVNPLGNSARWYFEYGTTTDYGSKTPAKSAGSGTAATGVSAAIGNLSPLTTYHYRLVATSRAGTTFGSDVTFTTVAAVTLAASTYQSIFGHYVTFSGTIASRQSGIKVTIQAEPLGSTSFSAVGTVLTGASGTWTYQARPRIATAYQASSPDGTSSAATVGVHPAVSLRLITKARFATRVVASKSFAGKQVKLQRQVRLGKWVTVARSRLNAKSSAIFFAKSLPLGKSMIRIAMSVNQAGRGFLAGFSRTLQYKRSS